MRLTKACAKILQVIVFITGMCCIILMISEGDSFRPQIYGFIGFMISLIIGKFAVWVEEYAEDRL